MNKIKWILSAFKSFKTFGKEFWFKRNLSAKVFQILIPKTMKGEISQPSRALEPWRGGFASKNFSAQNTLENSSYFSLIFFYPPQPPYHEDHGCIYRERRVWKGQRGVEGAAFLPPTSCLTCMPTMLCPHLLKKRKTKKKYRNGSRDTVPASTVF